jgi:hypothetical protein
MSRTIAFILSLAGDWRLVWRRSNRRSQAGRGPDALSDLLQPAGQRVGHLTQSFE